ncbi:MAG TPA: hypothetical protein VIF60_17270 [Burkholderiaceae bacterium]
MNRPAILFLLTLSFSFTVAVVADEKSFVAIHGFDKMSCQDWFGSEDHPTVRQQYIDWIRGVVTGYNYSNQNDQVSLGRMPSDFALGVFVDNYCHSSRATSVAGAAFALIAERRGSTAVQVLGGGGVADTKARGSGEEDGFNDWLDKQSADMRSLDISVLKNIYKKESALPGK